METITAATNLNEISDSTIPYTKGQNANDGLDPIPIVVDENQENSVDNQQCQNQCVRLNRKCCNKTASHHCDQPCACDPPTIDNMTNCILNGGSDTIMANATNGRNHLNANQIANWTDTIKSNGGHHRRDNEGAHLNHSTDKMDVCDYQLFPTSNQMLANLRDANRMGQLDTMVSSDLDETEITLAATKCTNDIVLNGNDQSNGCNHVIEKGHRRTRARSESDQCEFYEARKQQMRRQAQHESNLFESGSDEYLSQSDTTVRTFYVKTVLGKSLSPPKLVTNRKSAINSGAQFNRCLPPRHLARPLNILRKQKLLSKARQQAKLSPHHSPTKMGKTIAKNIPTELTDKTVNDKVNSSDESEYSSLEDDDDIQDANDSDENDLSDTDESFHCDNKAIYNSYNGSITEANHSMLADSVQGQYAKSGPLAPSLFAHVPPYITFVSHEAKGPMMPADIKKILKWKLTTITPIVIRKVLLNSGFRLLKQTNDWMGTWGKHMKSPCFRTLKCYQKINHIPGSFQIGRKDRIWRNLQSQMMRNGRNEFNFMPLSYILPHDLKRLKRLWPQFTQRNTKWIIKPPASARGTGIKVVSKWKQIPKRKPMIVQKYIDRPLLIDGSKFDLRLYVLITSFNPLRAYMHTDGLARFASVKYSNDIDTLSDRYMHLTNYSINKMSSNYAKNEDVDSCNGHKWTLKTLWKYFATRDINTNAGMEIMR